MGLLIFLRKGELWPCIFTKLHPIHLGGWEKDLAFCRGWLYVILLYLNNLCMRLAGNYDYNLTTRNLRPRVGNLSILKFLSLLGKAETRIQGFEHVTPHSCAHSFSSCSHPRVSVWKHYSHGIGGQGKLKSCYITKRVLKLNYRKESTFLILEKHAGWDPGLCTA